MTRGTVLCSIAVAAILVTFVAIGSAAANPRFTVSVNRTKVVSGHTLTVTATANVSCEWGIRWAGQTRLKRNTRVLVARFIAPRVSKARKYRLLAICNYRAKVAPSTTRPGRLRKTPHHAAMAVEAIVPPHWVRTIVITVDPRRSVVTRPRHILLPDTGGPAGSLLLLAFGLLLTGTGLVRLSRSGHRTTTYC